MNSGNAQTLVRKLFEEAWAAKKNIGKAEFSNEHLKEKQQFS